MSQNYNLSPDISHKQDMSQKYIYKAEKHPICHKTESVRSPAEGVESFSIRVMFHPFLIQAGTGESMSLCRAPICYFTVQKIETKKACN